MQQPPIVAMGMSRRKRGMFLFGAHHFLPALQSSEKSRRSILRANAKEQVHMRGKNLKKMQKEYFTSPKADIEPQGRGKSKY